MKIPVEKLSGNNPGGMFAADGRMVPALMLLSYWCGRCAVGETDGADCSTGHVQGTTASASGDLQRSRRATLCAIAG
ncbi:MULTISPECIES: hypothetical protein [unclassified Cupriavidus]|uniref:hypothetical protein n=1 Tax=unclassified Cupriavidus TaxID=2640874 RepID=UPI0010F4C665|nr:MULTISPECIES: hypothetical protein [unclassified Cupriavidus]MWL87975.1 hypothetical protein [Cupriavidus sp. SW-Y-13]